MSLDNWRKVEKVYNSVLACAPDERSRFLTDACKDDPELLRQVRALLEDSGSDPSYFSGQRDTATATGGGAGSATVQWAAGSLVGPYRIESVLGAGGMGQVYRARDTRLHRDVAMKTGVRGFGERFRREAHIIAALNHPNICHLYDVGADFLVMELVEGETLRQWLKRAPGLDAKLAVARQVLEALRAAHGAGIVHRDLKPENIMIRPDGYVKVLDFGLAKLLPGAAGSRGQGPEAAEISIPGQILGTLAYMPPERILGRDAEPRSDLFSLGVILYQMLARKHPWPRASVVDTLHAILHDEPAPISDATAAGTGLASIVQRLLRKDPAERFASAEAVLAALGSAAGLAGSSPADGERAEGLMTSIAVLPFVLLSEIEEGKALSLGFADALITTLGSLEDVRVLPTSAILNYAAGAAPGAACRELGVRYTLQGTVQKLGAQWRVSLQLFDSTTQTIARAEKHDFKLENAFDVQDEIARRVAESLQSQFSPVVSAARERYSRNPDAYEAFMAGLRESYSDQREKVESAIQHLSQAIQHDPDFGLAHATLSHMCASMYYTFDPRRVWLEEAEEHCSRALSLDTSLPEAHMARAWILWSAAKNFQHAEAIAALEQALALQPNLERAHNRISSICWHIGRIPEALTAHELAQRANPRTVVSNLTSCYLYGGQFDLAEEAAQGWLQRSPGNLFALNYLTLSALMKGDLDRAGERSEEALRRAPEEPLLIANRGLWHARLDRVDAALECARKALDSPRSFGHTHHTYYAIAGIHAVLGEPDKAMAWLERTADTGFPCWSFFRIDPHLDSLRAKLEFQQLAGDLERKSMAIKIERL